MIVYRQAATTSANTDGQIPEDGETFCTRWARVEPLRGRERLLAAQTQADIDYRVTLPYDRDTKTITPSDWIVLKQTSERLNIVRAFDPDLKQQEIECECRRRV